MLLSHLVRFAVLVLSVLLAATQVHSHPHNWIELNTTVVLDSQAHVVQVRQKWQFDMFYSLMMHADLLNEFGDEQKGLEATAESMIINLKDYRYFSSLSLDGLDIDIGVPSRYQLLSKKKDGDLVLELEMTFDIEPKVKIENKTLALKIYDPTYYIAMNHATEGNIEIIGGNATECSKRLEFPKPSEELIDYAQSLDRTQRNTDGLGANFAETAFINCI